MRLIFLLNESHPVTTSRVLHVHVAQPGNLSRHHYQT
jgi:hypothetical protein